MKKKGDPQIAELKYLEDTLYVLSGKWKLHILFTISNGYRRFKDIQRAIPGITARMLSKELKELEANKIVMKKNQEDSLVRVDYEITEYCQSFDLIIRLMIDWGKEHRKYLSRIDKK